MEYNDTIENIEILAPAGDFECFKAAVDNGANAVYIGGQKFSARKNAVNFTDDEILNAVSYAHLRGVKVHVAVNILVHEFELKDAFDYIKFLHTAKVDALIVQDLGVLKLTQKYFPDMCVHASTQMTVHNLDGAIKAKELGFKRVVLSRELSFDEIEYITKNCGIETEVFAHGALCMCYSGQCLLSSLIGGRSGNRGECAQPCRLPYTLCNEDKKVIGQEKKYLMSLKDLCLIDDIKKFKDIGVSSLKIEGRMKNKEYVALVTHMYNKYRNNSVVSDEDYKMLENIFSRNGFTKGYLENNTGRQMLNYDKNNDNVYDEQKDNVLNLAHELIHDSENKTKIYGELTVKIGQPLSLTLKYKNFTVTAQTDVIPQKALKTATDILRIDEQIKKLGSTAFVMEKCDIFADDNINVPIKAINEVRRIAVEKLEKDILTQQNLISETEFNYKKNAAPDALNLLSAEVLNFEQAKCAYELGFDRIYIPYEVYVENKSFFDDENDIFCLMLPNIMRDKNKIDLKDVALSNVCVSNISQIQNQSKFIYHANYTMNIYNSLTQKELAKMGVKSVCLSPELNIEQIEDAASDIPFEIILYGRLKLMTVQNCIVNSANGKCLNNCGESYFMLKDRKDMYFPLFTQKGACTNTLYNSNPIFMADRLGEIDKLGAEYFRFIFTTENKQQIADIVNMYDNKKSYPDKTFTRGHYYRGVL